MHLGWSEGLAWLMATKLKCNVLFPASIRLAPFHRGLQTLSWVDVVSHNWVRQNTLRKAFSSRAQTIGRFPLGIIDPHGTAFQTSPQISYHCIYRQNTSSVLLSSSYFSHHYQYSIHHGLAKSEEFVLRERPGSFRSTTWAEV